MRLSVDKRDKGYRFDLAKNKCVVYFNDQPRTDVITADEEEGLIVAYVRDFETGKPKTNPEQTAFLTETLRGRVRIEINDAEGGSVKDPKVKAELEDRGILMLIYSKMQPGNIRRILVERKAFPDEQTLLLACEAAAGAAAEYCCNMHGDVFEPKEVAEAGLEAAQKLLEGINDANKLLASAVRATRH